ncbi:MAG: DUF3226 domain-containing protein [Planctomycetota bacterium]
MIPRPPETAPPPPIPVSLSKVLLVEGKTPLHFFEALLSAMGVRSEVEILDFGGVDQFRAFVRTLASTSDFRRLVKSLGVVCDAESDAKARRQSADDALAAAGLPKGVRTSVFILPDNRSPGMIETLCIESVRQAPVFACVEQFFQCVEGQGVDLSEAPQSAKNYAQAFLASRKEVQLYPGIAAYRGY